MCRRNNQFVSLLKLIDGVILVRPDFVCYQDRRVIVVSCHLRRFFREWFFHCCIYSHWLVCIMSLQVDLLRGNVNQMNCLTVIYQCVGLIIKQLFFKVIDNERTPTTTMLTHVKFYITMTLS